MKESKAPIPLAIIRQFFADLRLLLDCVGKADNEPDAPSDAEALR